EGAGRRDGGAANAVQVDRDVGPTVGAALLVPEAQRMIDLVADNDLIPPARNVDDLGLLTLHAHRRIIEGAILETNAGDVARHGSAEVDSGPFGDGVHGVDGRSLVSGRDGTIASGHEIVGNGISRPEGSVTEGCFRLGIASEQVVIMV